MNTRDGKILEPSDFWCTLMIESHLAVRLIRIPILLMRLMLVALEEHQESTTIYIPLESFHRWTFRMRFSMWSIRLVGHQINSYHYALNLATSARLLSV